MKRLFAQADMERIAAASKMAQESFKVPEKHSSKMSSELESASRKVAEYFKDSSATLIRDTQSLSDYIDKMIEVGYGGIDTETTGLDRIHDTIVGCSLYYPGGVECYIPNKHIVPLFDTLYKDQLTYEETAEQLKRLCGSGCKLIFANADFDLAMIYKDYGVDLIPECYYDVILAWRCLKENERDNTLKGLYMKYVMKGKGDAMKFSDFFSPKIYPYSKPEIAKFYAANDAKITYELFQWQLPYVTKTHPKCQKNKLEAIADLVWNLEFPLIAVCQNMHRRGVYFDRTVAEMRKQQYQPRYDKALADLRDMVQAVMDDPECSTSKARPFRRAADFLPSSPQQVAYLMYDMLKLGNGLSRSTDKDNLAALNHPVADKVLECRSYDKLLGTYLNTLPKQTTADNRIHCEFRSIGADTGRMSSRRPNMQNIPSKAKDIRHIFRATPGYILLSVDFGSQEPATCAYLSGDKQMISAFEQGKDIYGTIGQYVFNVPYEECLEKRQDGSYNPDGKKRRDSMKTVILGAMYGRSITTIAEQLFGHDETLTDKEKLAKGRGVYDAVMNACPGLQPFMEQSQQYAYNKGYVETILGRRRHIPEMQLSPFEFHPMKEYTNPDINPLDASTLTNTTAIPDRVIKDLEAQFSKCKYFGQIVNLTKECAENGIRVVNNRNKIAEATRQCVNSRVQGSAADESKMAMLLVENNQEWNDLGGRLLIPVHDELIAEVPIEHRERGAEILVDMMVKSTDFLPFKMKCDVEMSYRWYGLEAPCKYPMPTSLDNMTDENIKWLRYMLFESGYKITPVIPEGKSKSDLYGDEALGICGVMNDEIQHHIDDYKRKYGLTDDKFIEHIQQKVEVGE